MHDNDRLDAREYWDLSSQRRRLVRIRLSTSETAARWDARRFGALLDTLTARETTDGEGDLAGLPDTDGLYVDDLDAEQLTEWAWLLRGPWPSAAAHLEALAESRQALDDTRRDDADRSDQWR